MFLVTFILQQCEGAISIGGEIEDLGVPRFIEAAIGSAKFPHNSRVRKEQKALIGDKYFKLGKK